MDEPNPLNSATTPSVADAQAVERAALIGEILRAVLADTRDAVTEDGIVDAHTYFVSIMKVIALTSFRTRFKPFGLRELDEVIAELEGAAHALRQARRIIREMKQGELTWYHMDDVLEEVRRLKSQIRNP